MTNAHSTGAVAPIQHRKPNRKSSTAKFISKAVAIHFDEYDYSKVNYISSKEKVTIVCNKCGNPFMVTPNNHISGASGCPPCKRAQRGIKQRKTNKEFLIQAQAAHGSRYKYKKCKYEKNASKVVITCVEHGDFKQWPSDHILGVGCPVCAGVSKDNNKTFIEKANKAHGSKYSYDFVNYTSSARKVSIVCKEHGVFQQRANDHLNGKGCMKCAIDGFWGFRRSKFAANCDKHNKGVGTLYVIKCAEAGEVFYKIGITSKSVKERFDLKSSMPYEYVEVYNIRGKPEFIYNLERELHDALSEYKHEPEIGFFGQTECFTTIKPVERLLKRLMVIK